MRKLVIKKSKQALKNEIDLHKKIGKKIGKSVDDFIEKNSRGHGKSPGYNSFKTKVKKVLGVKKKGGTVKMKKGGAVKKKGGTVKRTTRKK